jgi:hypothetical protein
MGRSRAKRRRKAAKRTAAAKKPAARKRQPLVPWRRQMAETLDALRAWSRDHYQAALDAHLAGILGEAADQATPEDRQRAMDDCICAPGSTGDGPSILQVFCDQAPGLAEDVREQARRWEKERRRGVFVVQSGAADRLGLWDPLEGASITLHPLEKLGATAQRLAKPGAVVTATYQPWMARLVVVQAPEFFADPRALELFRSETASSGARWHEPPAPAPERHRAGPPASP